MPEDASIDQKIKELENEMAKPDFWSDKEKAKNVIKEIAELKAKKEGFGKFDKGNAIININKRFFICTFIF